MTSSLLGSIKPSASAYNFDKPYCCGYLRPLPGIRFSGTMRTALDEAINCAVKREFCSMLGCPNLSKLKSGLKTKSAVAACNLPSRGPECACELRGHTVHVGNKGCSARPRVPSHPIPRGGTHTPPNNALQPHDPGPSAVSCLWSLGEGMGDSVADRSPIV